MKKGEERKINTIFENPERIVGCFPFTEPSEPHLKSLTGIININPYTLIIIVVKLNVLRICFQQSHY